MTIELKDLPPGVLDHLVESYQSRGDTVHAKFKPLGGVADKDQQHALAVKLKPYFGNHGVKVGAVFRGEIPVEFRGQAADRFRSFC